MEPLTVPGTLDALSVLRGYVKEAGEKAGLDRKAIYRLSLAVDEIATNIVTHGYEEAGLQGEIKISAIHKPTTLTIRLEDNGRKYDPDDKQPKSIGQPIEDRPIGGLGVFLAIQGVDEFHYERAGDCNQHTFVVCLPGQ